MHSKNTDSRRPHKENHKAKEELMANKEHTTDHLLWNSASQAQDAWKEIYGYQIKTTQTLVDQMMKWGQTYTDHLYTQVNEATRLSQEYLKSGNHFAEELRKNYYQMTEKVTK